MDTYPTAVPTHPTAVTARFFDAERAADPADADAPSVAEQLELVHGFGATPAGFDELVDDVRLLEERLADLEKDKQNARAIRTAIVREFDEVLRECPGDAAELEGAILDAIEQLEGRLPTPELAK